jgi:hypothetical protein
MPMTGATHGDLRPILPAYRCRKGLFGHERDQPIRHLLLGIGRPLERLVHAPRKASTSQRPKLGEGPRQPLHGMSGWHCHIASRSAGAAFPARLKTRGSRMPRHGREGTALRCHFPPCEADRAAESSQRPGRGSMLSTAPARRLVSDPSREDAEIEAPLDQPDKRNCYDAK